jgi:hypothetical protein
MLDFEKDPPKNGDVYVTRSGNKLIFMNSREGLFSTCISGRWDD